MRAKPIHRILSFALILGVIGLALSANPAQVARAQGQKAWIFTVWLPPSLLGEGSASIFLHFQKLLKTFKEGKGLSVEMDVAANRNAVVARLRDDKAQIAYLTPLQYLEAKEEKIPIEPIVAFKWNGGAESRSCIYVRKNGEIQSPPALLGAKGFAFPDKENWLLLNKIFEENEIFSNLSAVDFLAPDTWKKEVLREDSVYHLLLKRVDGLVMEESYLPFIAQTEGVTQSIRALICTRRAYPTIMIVARKTMPQSQRAKLKLILLNMHHDPDFADFRSFFNRVPGGQFTETTDRAWDTWRDLWKEAREKGWDQDYDKIKKAK